MANSGHTYESNLVNKLIKEGLTPSSFTAAGSSGAIDLKCYHGVVCINFELKSKLFRTDFGQSSLKYNPDLEDGKRWVLHCRNNPSAMLLKEKLLECGIGEFVNERWGLHGAPRKLTVRKHEFTQEDLNYDKIHFTDLYMPVPTSIVHEYYDSKNINYIQISGYGLYYLKNDEHGLGVPQFTAPIHARSRLKNGGNSLGITNYRFAIALTVLETDIPCLEISNRDLEKDTSFLNKSINLLQ